MQKFKIIIIMFFVFLYGCGGRPPRFPEAYTESKVQSKQNGVAFLKISEKGNSLYFKLRKVGDKGDSYDLDQENNSFFGFSKEFDYSKFPIMLEPGYYYIDYVSLLSTHLYRSTVYRWLPSPGLKNGMVRYGLFEIKPGEVLCLGELKINRHSDDTSFELSDSFEQVKAQLNKRAIHDKEYEFLVSKLKRGKLYLSGSVFYTNKQGIKTIISNEDVDKMRNEIINDVIKQDQKKKG